MKTALSFMLALFWIVISPAAEAAVYLGSWNNTTFGSTGALRIELTRTKSKVSVKLDLDGPVFGSFDPPVIPFSAPLDSKGGGKFNVKGSPLGDLTGSFSPTGALTMKIVNIPGGTLTEFRFGGNFDLKRETFMGTYEIDSGGGLFAEGTATAHVRKAPKITLPVVVKFTGKSASATAKITSNSKIKSVTATTPDGAKVAVKGTNSVRITVSKIKKAKTRVTLVVTNADNKTAKKTVTFVGSGSGTALLDLLGP